MIEAVLAGHRVTIDGPANARFAVILLVDAGLSADVAFESEITFIRPQHSDPFWSFRPFPDSDEPSAEDWLLKHLLPYLASEQGRNPPAIGLLGIGFGGQAAIRLGFRHPKWFPVIAGFEPALDFHEIYGRGTILDFLYVSREKARQDTAILHFSPLKFPKYLWFGCEPGSPWFRGADRLHEKLTALGVEHHTDFTPMRNSGQTWIDERLPGVLNAMKGALLEESRRLL